MLSPSITLTFGAGGATNLMTAGGARMIPIPTNVPQSSPVTAQWVLEESPNATSSSALDLLTMGTKGDGVSQQGQALLSGFLNADTVGVHPTQPGGGGDASVQTAAASRRTIACLPGLSFCNAPVAYS